MNDDISSSVGERLYNFWLCDGHASLRAPVAEQEIRSFEGANGIALPSDFLEYLKRVDGFDQSLSYQDERGFNFWPLKSLTCVQVYEGGRYGFTGGQSYFLFGDYLDFSWGYALSMDPANRQVVLVGTKDGRQKVVADSFSTFVDAYLRDDAAIYL